LRSCVESLLICTEDYPNKELIIIDNASVEAGTSEYLSQLETRGFRVVRNVTRDPANEFARGLNTIVNMSTGDFVVLLQGDMQFVVKGGWLRDYVQLATDYSAVGCVTLDAQRRVTNMSNMDDFSSVVGGSFKFVMNRKRPPVSGAADVFYTKNVLDMIGPWSENNVNHEGTLDSETDMLRRVDSVIRETGRHLGCFMPIVPVSIAIYTDQRGTNARVRGDKRYGDYWPPKSGDDVRYYDFVDYSDITVRTAGRTHPVSIEELAIPLGWNAPIDSRGGWLKNPIRPETAKAEDYVSLSVNETVNDADSRDYLDDWVM
jgi:glycosyltransferase involved in cell wall biosynthesis